MNQAIIFWTALVGVVAYILAVEPLFFSYLLLQVLRFTLFVERQWVKLMIHPDSPWMQMKIRSNANRIAQQLLDELTETNGTKRELENDDSDGGPTVE